MEHYSPTRQDTWLVAMTGGKTGGVFVELDVSNGPSTFINTRYCVEHLGWSGYLINDLSSFGGLMHKGQLPSYVDFMSVGLDVPHTTLEGVDWDNTSIALMAVSHNGDATTKKEFYDFLTNKGFSRIVNNAPNADLESNRYMSPQDDWYINTEYFKSQITTFVTIHSEELVIECYNSERFKYLSNVVYLCVGNRSFNNLPDDIPAIICKNYEPNWEQYPSFYDFTGWACLAEHKLIKTPYAIMLQYDHAVTNMALELPAIELLGRVPSMVGLVAAQFNPYWILNVPGFKGAFIKASKACGGPHPDAVVDGGIWPTTQGTAWSRDFLYGFMEWFKPTFEAVKDEVFAGHVAERMVKLYTAVTLPPHFLLGRVIHQAKDSHGTGSLMSGNKEEYELKSKKFFSV